MNTSSTNFEHSKKILIFHQDCWHEVANSGGWHAFQFIDCLRPLSQLSACISAIRTS